MQIPGTSNPANDPISTEVDPIPGQGVPTIPAEKPNISLAWKVRLMVGTVMLATVRGHHAAELFETPDQALRFLSNLDTCLDTRIARPLSMAVRNRYLQKRNDQEDGTEAKSVVKVKYDIRVSVTGRPVRGIKGAVETVLEMDPVSIRGQVGLLERSWRQMIFAPVKVQFRQVAATVVAEMNQYESAESVQGTIRQQLHCISMPDMIPEDEPPPVLAAIETADRAPAC